MNKLDKLYTKAMAAAAPPKEKRKREKFVFIEWRDTSGKYNGGNYKESDVPILLEKLRAQGLKSVSIEEEETLL